MKTDKIFYTLFQAFPELLFQLIGESPEFAQDYEFKSIEIKELSFRLDGVFLPSDNHPDHPLYFVEVQFQADPDFYWRFFTEIILYLNQHKPIRQWQAVVLWGKESLDSELPLPYHLFRSHLQIVYLDQLPQTPSSIALSIIQLVTIPESQAPQQAKSLLNQVRQQINDVVTQANVIELVEKIIIYKFPQKSRQELEKMFDLTDWKQTQFYKEVKLEGKLEGKVEGKLQAKLETIPLLRRLGLTVEQISQELDLDISLIHQFLANQNN
jgi:predicted transposase/invertase (TIGR01784 family)